MYSFPSILLKSCIKPILSTNPKRVSVPFACLRSILRIASATGRSALNSAAPCPSVGRLRRGGRRPYDDPAARDDRTPGDMTWTADPEAVALKRGDVNRDGGRPVVLCDEADWHDW